MPGPSQQIEKLLDGDDEDDMMDKKDEKKSLRYTKKYMWMIDKINMKEHTELLVF